MAFGVTTSHVTHLLALALVLSETARAGPFDARIPLSPSERAILENVARWAERPGDDPEITQTISENLHFLTSNTNCYLDNLALAENSEREAKRSAQETQEMQDAADFRRRALPYLEAAFPVAFSARAISRIPGMSDYSLVTPEAQRLQAQIDELQASAYRVRESVQRTEQAEHERKAEVCANQYRQSLAVYFASIRPARHTSDRREAEPNELPSDSQGSQGPENARAANPAKPPTSR